MKKLQAPLSLLATVALSITLVGCGGGGGDASTSTRAPSQNTDQPNSADYTPPQTSVQTPNLTGSLAAEQVQSFEYLNRLRTASGLGALNYSAALEVAATGHAAYNAENQIVSHFQTQGQPGFTGVSLDDRIAAANYRATASIEVVAAGAPSVQTMDAFLSAPYHRIGLLAHDVVDVGIGYSSGSTYQMRTVVNAGRTGAQQGWTTTSLITTFPYDGQRNVPTTMVNETPYPYPELGAWCNPSCPGYTISIQSRKGQTVTDVTFIVTGQNGSAIQGKTITQANDSMLASSNWGNWAFFIPAAPLNANETYTVNVTAKVSGQPVTQTWSFTTRAQNNTISARQYGDIIIVDTQAASNVIKNFADSTSGCAPSFDSRSSTTQTGAVYTVLASGGASCRLNVTLYDAATNVGNSTSVATNQ